ncbi:hypothetical protein [Actinomyces glycerinitolerans]|uniref:Uncharacterized protein n=1 Tax=Actinomyces glycerinitolerans TaxID=1892869 RepID=A0A1M4RYS4_9ACTO|nr:hypothetical protein [Actinomyces glycerinitolerans]SHE25060.1 Hypothetical protein ACGLYG10_1272 [Actinomyces glycerinitolerans]
MTATVGMTAPAGPTGVDRTYLAALHENAAWEADTLLATEESFLAARPSHRRLARAMKIAVACHLSAGSRLHGDRSLIAYADRLTRSLETLQGDSGLFSGDNLDSPPDSSFTANDLMESLELLDADAGDDVRALSRRLEAMVRRLDPALQAGGVHTPNHRWELVEALTHLERRWPDPARRARIDEWLAEGIDVDTDGQYSERSANYAIDVSNRSLLSIATALGLPALVDIVEHNLTTMTLLTDPAGNVETMHSRRQDQRGDVTVSLGRFHHQLRRIAIERNRSDLAWWAQRAWDLGIPSGGDELACVLLHPVTASLMPTPVAPADGVRVLDSGLVVRTHGDQRLVVDGYSDYPAAGRIASGLACNPTFMHAWLGGVELRSLRLSRNFFGLGPFRPTDWETSDDTVVLRESASADYYLPLDAASRHEDGTYDMEFEGRFAARMAFSRRKTISLRLDTEVSIRDLRDGIELSVDLKGPCTGACLEIALGDDVEVDGARALGEEAFVLNRTATLSGNDGTVIDVVADRVGRVPAFYEPGEEYRYLGGTDALAGTRLYVTIDIPGTLTLRLTRAV